MKTCDRCGNDDECMELAATIVQHNPFVVHHFCSDCWQNLLALDERQCCQERRTDAYPVTAEDRAKEIAEYSRITGLPVHEVSGPGRMFSAENETQQESVCDQILNGIPPLEESTITAEEYERLAPLTVIAGRLE